MTYSADGHVGIGYVGCDGVKNDKMKNKDLDLRKPEALSCIAYSYLARYYE